MKTNFRQTTALFCVGAALLFGATTVRADDDAKTHHRRHHQENAERAEPARKAITAIPTRDDRASQETKGNVVGGANGPEYRVRTGTNLPDHYNRRGYSTDSRDNTTIYDKNDFRLQHTNNVQDALRDDPSISVRGLR